MPRLVAGPRSTSPVSTPASGDMGQYVYVDRRNNTFKVVVSVGGRSRTLTTTSNLQKANLFGSIASAFRAGTITVDDLSRLTNALT